MTTERDGTWIKLEQGDPSEILQSNSKIDPAHGKLSYAKATAGCSVDWMSLAQIGQVKRAGLA